MNEQTNFIFKRLRNEHAMRVIEIEQVYVIAFSRLNTPSLPSLSLYTHTQARKHTILYRQSDFSQIYCTNTHSTVNLMTLLYKSLRICAIQ